MALATHAGSGEGRLTRPCHQPQYPKGVAAAIPPECGIAAATRDSSGARSLEADRRDYFQIGFDQALRPVSSMTMTRSQGLFSSGASETLVRVIEMPLLWLIR